MTTRFERWKRQCGDFCPRLRLSRHVARASVSASHWSPAADRPRRTRYSRLARSSVSDSKQGYRRPMDFRCSIAAARSPGVPMSSHAMPRNRRSGMIRSSWSSMRSVNWPLSRRANSAFARAARAPVTSNAPVAGAMNRTRVILRCRRRPDPSVWDPGSASHAPPRRPADRRRCRVRRRCARRPPRHR